jgi:pimeloyl-ACP methyl ester carboxylesterase
VRSTQFELPGLTLAAEAWGEPGGFPVLALHGWLDNAASFELLAPRLEDAEVVALDLAGHGLSGFRSPDASYNLWQDVGDVLEVVDRLGWQRFALLGHSRGAAIAMLFAGTFPERVAKLALIEGGMPLVGEAGEAPAKLAQALLERRSLRGKSGRVFVERAQAIRERAEGFTKISLAAAEILARRSLREVPGGFQWHADQRLKGQSELRFTAEHARAFARRVTAPTFLALAEQGPFGAWPLYREASSLFASLEVVRLPGGHHLHLEGGEVAIAAALGPFLAA